MAAGQKVCHSENCLFGLEVLLLQVDVRLPPSNQFAEVAYVIQTGD